MQRQKTIAKWLAVLMLLTLAVASYVALNAIFGGRVDETNIAGAQDGNGTDEDNEPSPDIGEQTPPSEEQTPPHIPVYSQFPREAETVGELYALNIGGEGDDILLDRITCFGKDILFFDSTSREYDVSESGLHLASIAGGALEGTLFIGENEEYIDSTLSTGGLLVVTRNESQTLLRLISRELKITLKNAMPRYDSYALFTSGGALRLYVANADEASVYTISRTLSASKSNRRADLPNADIVCIMPTATVDILFLQTDSGISVYTFSTNEGFISQSELLNCRFEQILPIVTDGQQSFALLASSDDGYTLARLDKRGKQCESVNIEGATSAAMLKNGTNVTVLTKEKLYTFCSHIELTGCTDISRADALFEDGKLRATEEGALYCESAQGAQLLSFDGDVIGVTLTLSGAEKPMIADADGKISIAYSCSASDFEGLGFGKTDVYFVIDSGEQI